MTPRAAILAMITVTLILTGCAQSEPGALGLAENPTEETTTLQPDSSEETPSLEPESSEETVPADSPQDPQPAAEASVAPEASSDAAAPETDAIVTESTEEQPPPDLELSAQWYQDPASDLDRLLCTRLRERSPDNWWKQGDVFGRDLVETCKQIFNVIVVGDCLVMPDGSCPGADLSGANLAGAQLARMNLHGANLSGANLAGAHMTFADLSGANLDGARLDNAQLYGVNLRGASINGTSFAGAELRYATWVDGRRCSVANIKGRCG